MTPTDNSLPQWAINVLIWFAVAIVSVFTAVYGYFARKYILKIDELEKKQDTFAVATRVMEIELRLPEFMSRGELLAYMAKRDEDLERRYSESRQDQIRMHGQNMESNDNLREDIRGIHSRIDELFGRGGQ